MNKFFDPHHLKTLVAFADTGTLSKAAEVVGRTPSTITAQMQKLEEYAEVPLFETQGRNRLLTPAGERLVVYARRILNDHQEAWLNLSTGDMKGRVVLGITQDFLKGAAHVLKQFARAHNQMCIDLRVGKTAELLKDYKAGNIDVLVGMRQSVEEDEVACLREQMQWFCSKDGLMTEDLMELPIAALEQPCGFRKAMLQALDEAKRPYRIVCVSPSLEGVATALQGGIALSVRTSRWDVAGLQKAEALYDLPELPFVEFSIRVQGGCSKPVGQLAGLLADGLHFTSRSGA